MVNNNPKLVTLDDLDWDIIKELNLNPRINIKDLADKLNKSRNTIASRLSKLEEKGYNNDENSQILNSIIIPNYRRIGAISGYILATCTAGANQQKVAKKISDLKGVEEVSVITGEWDFIIRITAKDMDQIGETIIQDLRKESGIQKTITCISFWTYRGKNPFQLLLPDKS